MKNPLLDLMFLFVVKTNGQNCGNSCCSGFQTNLAGQCIECPPGLFGLKCNFSCPSGFYGPKCQHNCQCAIIFCNATVGCINSYDLNYLNPTTVTIVIPTTLGLISVFGACCTIIVVKMRQKAQQRIREAAGRTYIHEAIFTSSEDTNHNHYNQLNSFEESPLPPYPKEGIDFPLDNKIYDICELEMQEG